MIQDRFGPLMQVAYIVDDLDNAIRHWAEVLRVGPFFVIDHLKYKTLTYRGQATDADVSLAFAFSGDLQIELVQQHNAAPSIYRDFIERQGQGVQHVGALTDDLAGDVARLGKRGIKPIQHGISATGTETVYFDSAARPGEMLELIQTSPQLHDAFRRMKEAAQHWDGANARAG